MNTILKYPLEDLDTGGLREIKLPQGARILAVQVQDEVDVYVAHGGIRAYASAVKETVCLWAMSNTKQSKTVRRMFRIYGTGHKIEEPLESLDYIGSVQTGPFVWHVFERKGGRKGVVHE